MILGLNDEGQFVWRDNEDSITDEAVDFPKFLKDKAF